MSILRPAGTSRPADLTARSRLRVGRRVALLFLITLLATALYSAASASSSRSRARAGRPEAAAPARAAKAAPAPARPAAYAPAPLRQFAVDTPLPPVEKIEIRSADCSTLQDSFLLGETVCVKVFDGPSRAILNRLTLTGPAGNYRNPTNTDAGATDPTTGAVSTFGVTTDPQTFTIQLPTTPTSLIDGVAVENRGEWRVNSLLASRFLIRNTASFTVSQLNNPSADLAVYNNLGSDPSGVGAGSSVDYVLLVANNGPDAAENVTVSDATLANATLVSATQTSGTPFTCPNADMAGNCTDGAWTVASLPRKGAATFKLTYLISGGATAGSVITNTATVTSDTDDPAAANDSSDADITLVSGAAPGACVISCPGNITRTADTTDENDQPGAIVTFGGAETQGSCGTLTASTPSGSFFPAGTTTVTISSSEGASCSFVVTVVNTPPPTISCPAPVTKQAADGDCNATLTAAELGTPSSTGTDVDVTSVRSDGLDLDAPFPAGVTTITYTATDSIGRTASCTQTVTVNVNDTINPTITAPPDVVTTTGAGGATCGKIISEAELGTADADDNCTVHVTRAGVPAGNFFPVGTTTVTYTATDGAGNTAVATQHVTVTETTPPIIFAPPDASYTCPNDVPAANPSQASGPLVDASGVLLVDGSGNLVPGGVPYDNCGTPVVTVTESSSGAGNAASPRVILRTFKATDASGNFATATQTITVTDSTPPVISCPANITVTLPAHTPATSMAVSYSAPTASDNCAGVTVTTSKASGSSFNVGTTTVTATATDWAGNTSSCSFNVTVLYDFSGFFNPVGNLPTLNVVNAGRAIPVKFSLSGSKGLNIFAAGYPASGPITCNSSDPAVDLTETVTAGNSSLSYDAGGEQYNYVWKTESSWAGTCRQLIVKLNDGTEHRANFKFK
jgi:uncharacterized repeat protein (TIGR01451 family)